MNNRIKFNTFLFVSTFARSLIEVFIALFLFKSGFSINSILLFYLLENLFALFISYFFVKIGERFSYSIVMCIGIISFAVLQIALNGLVCNDLFIVLIAFLYSLYRRGYWVARRYYVTNVMPQKNSSGPFSIMLVVSEIASIAAGFLGSSLLDGLNIFALTAISSVLLFISVVPLLTIKAKSKNTKVALIKNLKKYDKRNYLAFSLFEINNLLAFIFPIYIAIYIKDSYTMAGVINTIGGLAIIVFILVYGKIIKKRNYFVISSILFVMICFAKLVPVNYLIFILCFVEGFIKKMQEQSVNKIYYENRNDMDLTHYNLIYQMLESFARAIITVPLFFINDVRIMIVFVLVIIGAEIVFYACLKKSSKLR